MHPPIEFSPHRHDLTGLALCETPLALARIHRSLPTDEPVEFIFDESHPREAALTGTDPPWSTILHRGGFAIEGTSGATTRARSEHALPDQVATGLRVLVVGLNPSLYSADTGVAYGRPGNRFWPAAMASGLVAVDRDPSHAVLRDRVGFTDLVRRPTRRADELSRSDFIDGHRRLAELVEWLAPGVVCVVGLGGWRAAVDRSTTAGLQSAELAGCPVYVMPSTSGLNASSSLDDLTEHFRRVRILGQRDH